jgi:hypothetical protein
MTKEFAWMRFFARKRNRVTMCFSTQVIDAPPPCYHMIAYFSRLATDLLCGGPDFGPTMSA